MNPGDTLVAPFSARSASTLNEGRGVNPGDTTKSRPFLGCGGQPLNEGRGVNPGDTGRRRRGCSRRGCALNEGRGVNPGDTGMIFQSVRAADRSTKAGA